MQTATDIQQRTLVLTRVFDAPPQLVFKAWSEPRHLVRWFGPNHFTLPACEQDFQVGGKYRLCMHAPDGSDHWVWGEYREINEYDRLVFTWIRQDDKPAPWVENVVTLTFEKQGGKTRFTLHHALFDTQAFRDEHEGGWSECLDRLGAFVRLRGPAEGDREILTTRSIHAPVAEVFKAWTDPDLLAKWWGPRGFTNTFHRFELKPEGPWDFTMHGLGQDFPNNCVFRRIEPPAYLEFDHLGEMHFYKAMVTFTEVSGGTLVEWAMRFDTAKELAPIRAFIERANEENMDKLEDLLKGWDMSHPNTHST